MAEWMEDGWKETIAFKNDDVIRYFVITIQEITVLKVKIADRCATLVLLT